MESIVTSATIKLHSKLIADGYRSAKASYDEYLKDSPNREIALFYLNEANAYFSSAEVIYHTISEISDDKYSNLTRTFEYFSLGITFDLMHHQNYSKNTWLFENINKAYNSLCYPYE